MHFEKSRLFFCYFSGACPDFFHRERRKRKVNVTWAGKATKAVTGLISIHLKGFNQGIAAHDIFSGEAPGTCPDFSIGRGFGGY